MDNNHLNFIGDYIVNDLAGSTNMKHLLGLVGLFSVLAIVLVPTYVYGVTYGEGSYGACQYQTCSISLSSSGNVSVDVTPAGSTTKCSVKFDNVSVTTGSSTGYSVSLSDGNSSNLMTGPVSSTISPVSGTDVSPVSLSANHWGYRVDGMAGFGTGPTNEATNSSVPALSFAAVPVSSSQNVIATSASAANTPATTSVWYGVCADSGLASGTYTDDVVYTAVIN